MRRYGRIWVVVGVMLACVAAVVMLRQCTRPNPCSLPLPETLVQDAVALLRTDPSAWLPQTQRAVRSAAVLVEQGLVTSAEGCFVLAAQYQREENFAGAEGLYKRAIALRPDWSGRIAGWAISWAGTVLTGTRRPRRR